MCCVQIVHPPDFDMTQWWDRCYDIAHRVFYSYREDTRFMNEEAYHVIAINCTPPTSAWPRFIVCLDTQSNREHDNRESLWGVLQTHCRKAT
jgi:hypothetical protein